MTGKAEKYLINILESVRSIEKYTKDVDFFQYQKYLPLLKQETEELLK